MREANQPIPPFVTVLTSIRKDDVSEAESVLDVGGAFVRFMQQHADKYDCVKQVEGRPSRLDTQTQI